MQFLHPGPRALGAFLLAMLVVPAARPALGDTIPAPFGTSRLFPVIVLLVVAGITMYRGMRVTHHWLMRSPRRLLVMHVAQLAGLAALAVVLDLLVSWRATAFFTPQVLADVMAALLGLQLVGAIFRMIANTDALPRPTRFRGRLARRMREHVTADRLEGASAACIAGFWVLVAIGQREVAGVMLIFAGALLLTSIPVRIADAWVDARAEMRRIADGRRRWRSKFSRQESA